MTDTLIAGFALLIAFVLTVPPGYALLSVVWPSGDVLGRIALAPAVTIGLAMSWSTLLSKPFDLPVSPWTVLPIAWLAPIVLALVLLRIRGRGVGRLEAALAYASRVRRPDLFDLVMIGTGITMALILWFTISDSLTRIPGNDDGTHHVMWSLLISERLTIEPTRITVGDVLVDDPSWSFYPFGMHLQAAFAHSMFGIPIGIAAVSFPVLWSSVIFPLGTFAALRAMTPATSRVPALAAALIAVWPNFPWSTPAWGGFALIAAYSLVPAVVAAVYLLPLDPQSRPLRAGAVIGLAGLGIFFVQSSAAAAVVVFAIAVVPTVLVLATREHSVGTARVALTYGTAGVLAVLVLLPWFSALRAGTVERAGVFDSGGDLGGALSGLRDTLLGYYWLAPQAYQATLVVLMAIGLAVVLVRGTAWPWFVGAGVLLVLYLMIALDIGPARTLTVAWYSQRFRIGLHLGLLVMPLVAVGIAACYAVIAYVTRRPHQLVALAGAATFAVSLPASRLAHDWGSGWVEQAWAQTPEGDRVYEFLATRVRPGERVLNDFSQGSAWMYVNGGTAPIFASKPEINQTPNVFGDRMDLLFRAGEIGTDPRLTAIANRWNVKYAYVGPDVFVGHTIYLTPEILDASEGWRRLYTDGGAIVYERVS